jgi:thiol-disulfide isomerase/thioredoxin
MSDDAIVVDPAARFPRPVAAVIVGAIALATLVALAWPALPFNEGRRIVLGPTKVSVIMRQIENSGAAPRAGSPAPDFEWVRPDGSRASLASLRGRGIVINFWATWCEPCKKEMHRCHAPRAAPRRRPRDDPPLRRAQRAHHLLRGQRWHHPSREDR